VNTSVLYRSGRVHPMDDATTAATALVVRGGRVVATGNDADMRTVFAGGTVYDAGVLQETRGAP